MSLNRCEFIGRLGREPEMRYTQGGTAVTTFSIAVDRKWKGADGQQHEETEWVKVVAWNRVAEVAHEYLVKGQQVYIAGRMQTRKWQDKDGQDRYTTEIVVDDFSGLQMLAKAAGSSRSDYDEPAASNSSRPAPSRTQNRAPARNVPQAIDDTEDLPF